MKVFIIIDTIKDAATILALAGFYGGPGGAVTVPALFMLRKAFIDQQMGRLRAVGIVLTVVVLSLQKMLTILVEWEEMTGKSEGAGAGGVGGEWSPGLLVVGVGDFGGCVGSCGGAVGGLFSRFEN